MRAHVCTVTAFLTLYAVLQTAALLATFHLWGAGL